MFNAEDVCYFTSFLQYQPNEIMYLFIITINTAVKWTIKIIDDSQISIPNMSAVIGE